MTTFKNLTWKERATLSVALSFLRVEPENLSPPGKYTFRINGRKVAEINTYTRERIQARLLDVCPRIGVLSCRPVQGEEDYGFYQKQCKNWIPPKIDVDIVHNGNIDLNLSGQTILKILMQKGFASAYLVQLKSSSDKEELSMQSIELSARYKWN